MKNGTRYLLILWLIFNFGAYLYAQKVNYLVHSTQFNNTSGFSNNHVLQSFKDSRGMLWAVRDNGIDRFDGSSFKALRKPELTNRSALSILLEDEDHDLWIKRDDQKIFFLNINTERLRNSDEKFGPTFPQNTNFAIRGKDHSFLIQTDVDKIIRYYPGQPPEDFYKEPGMVVAPLLETEDGLVWLESNYNGNGGAMIALGKNRAVERVIPYTNSHIYGKGIWGGDTIHYMTRDSFYVANRGGVLTRKALKMMLPNFTFTDTYIAGPFPRVKVDPSRDLIWIYYSNELYVLDKSLQLMYHFNEPNQLTLRSNVYDLNIGRQQYVWLSSIYGLQKIWFSQNPFQQYLGCDIANAKGADLNSCRAIRQAADGQIYVLAPPSIFKLSKDGNAQKVILGDPLNGLGFVRAMDVDALGNIWYAATALCCYNVFSGKTITYPFDSQGTWAIKKVGQRVWLGNPLTWLDLKDGSLHKVEALNGFDAFEQAEIYDFYPKSPQELWLLSSNGLYVLDIQKGITAHYWKGGKENYYLPADNLRHLLEDSEGRFWIACTEGLLSWNEKDTEKTSLYGIEDGISNNCHGVLADEYGFLWISSDFRLIQFDPKTKRARSYYTSDGLSSDEFNRLSFCKSKSGVLYFGGINGIISFDPKDLATNFEASPSNASLVLTECRLFSGKSNEEEDIRNSVWANSRIDIMPGDRFLRVKVALTDYADPSKIIYKYRIKGFKEDWHLSRENELLVAGLPYGTYVLEVISFAAKGLLVNQKIEIPIKVWRPFYMQGWFFGLLALILAAAVYWYVKWRTKLLKKRKMQLESTVEESTKYLERTISASESATETEAELNEQGLQFLHEVREAIIVELDNTSLDVKMLCRLTGKSESHLHRKLKALTGLPAGRYIHQIRLQEARVLLQQKGLSITEVAFKTGFSDPAYFSRLFSKAFGQSPSAYRADL